MIHLLKVLGLFTVIFAFVFSCSNITNPTVALTKDNSIEIAALIQDFGGMGVASSFKPATTRHFVYQGNIETVLNLGTTLQLAENSHIK